MRKNKALKVVTGLIFVQIFFLPESLWSTQIIHVARRFAVEGSPVNVEISLTELNSVTQVTLFVRTSGTALYMPIPMTGGGRTYTAEIPGAYVRFPGVEYYIKAMTVAGSEVFFPTVNPTANPVTVKISTDGSRPYIRIGAPRTDEQISALRPVIAASLVGTIAPIDEKSVKIFLDGQEVTSSAKITANYVQYKPPVALVHGKHSVRVQARDINGTAADDQEWSFHILSGEDAGAAEIAGEEWNTTGSLSGQYQYSRVDSSGGTTNIAYPNGFATGNLDFKATRGDEEFFVGPLFFTTQETENQQPAQNLRFGYKNKRFENQWGNISANLTQLTGGGAMLGGEMVYYTQNKD